MLLKLIGFTSDISKIVWPAANLGRPAGVLFSTLVGPAGVLLVLFPYFQNWVFMTTSGLIS